MEAVMPYLLYEDVGAALDWLSRAFGFTETLRFTDDDGTVTHAELTTVGATIMLGHPGPDYRNPKRSGHYNGFLHVTVADVDAHFATAKAAGAQILAEPQDQEYGTRSYGATDPEGHRWEFATVLREVEPEDWGATRSS